MIKQVWNEQEHIRNNDKHLRKGLKENWEFVKLASDSFRADNKHFAKQLGKVFKASKKIDQEYRLRRLQAKNQELMDIVEDSGDIEEMQKMVVEVYKW